MNLQTFIILVGIWFVYINLSVIYLIIKRNRPARIVYIDTKTKKKSKSIIKEETEYGK